jgi:hypothetical protein
MMAFHAHNLAERQSARNHTSHKDLAEPPVLSRTRTPLISKAGWQLASLLLS